MKVCDFQRSFCHFSIDITKKSAATMSQPAPWTVNHARFPLECRCVLRDGGQERQYVLGAPCKGEQVYVERDLWQLPNPDWHTIMSAEHGLTIKSWSHRGQQVYLHPSSLGLQPLRHSYRLTEAFDLARIDLDWTKGTLLQNTDDIIAAGMANKPLVSQTEWTLDDGRQILIEYPVKCCNFGPRDHYYQVDTGPVLLPNPSRPHELEIEIFELAYIAHNTTEFAELIVNVPTETTAGVCVDHYSEPRRLDGVINRMICLN